MAINLADLEGNPYIGVFCRLMGDVLICPPDTSSDFETKVSETLGCGVHRTSAGSTNLHGSLLAANSKGLIAPYFYSLGDLEKKGGEGEIPFGARSNLVISEDHITAWGNNILPSEKRALVNPDLSRGAVKMVEDTLDVEAAKGTIAGIKTVGSIACMNSKGMVVHPKASEDELQMVKDLFSLDVFTSTANFGSPYLGASILANDRGALMGSKSSGVELNRVENSLDIID
ncbi:MAG: translation initiation factor IF-6 [Thermoplasmatota archaeon]